jgi:hypothetical protein
LIVHSPLLTITQEASTETLWESSVHQSEACFPSS